MSLSGRGSEVWRSAGKAFDESRILAYHKNRWNELHREEWIDRAYQEVTRLKNRIFQSRDLCLRALDTNSRCAKGVRRN